MLDGFLLAFFLELFCMRTYLNEAHVYTGRQPMIFIPAKEN